MSRLTLCTMTAWLTAVSFAAAADNAASYWTEKVGIQPSVASPGTNFMGTLKDPGKLKGFAMPSAVAGHGSSDTPIWGNVFKPNAKVRATLDGKGRWTTTDVKSNKGVKV